MTRKSNLVKVQGPDAPDAAPRGPVAAAPKESPKPLGRKRSQGSLAQRLLQGLAAIFFGGDNEEEEEEQRVGEDAATDPGARREFACRAQRAASQDSQTLGLLHPRPSKLSATSAAHQYAIRASGASPARSRAASGLGLEGSAHKGSGGPLSSLSSGHAAH